MKRGRHEYVIDGYNLLHCLFPGKNKPSLEKMRMETEKLLLAFQQNTGNPLTLVYDGKDTYREQAFGDPLHILFTPARKSADDWIVDYVKSLNTKIKLVTIVSSDNELRNHASAFGASCMKSEEFAELLQGGPGVSGRKSSRTSPKGRATAEKGAVSGELCDREIDRWKMLFLKGKP
ncbi:MAG: NYN domain-containing protein [Chlorobiaceae bacterium]|nr:NYN domain-containing protein [Chlorobiaceae bacterium]NTW09972.1 NYN domain-containing protein [Chlorobiaceae bacterium]